MRRSGWRYISVVMVLLVGLFCCRSSTEGEEAEGRGKIEAGKPRYVRKNHEAWQSRGRIVGIAREAPQFTVRILDASKQEVESTTAEKLKDGKRAYEIWLQPGTYILVIEAKGHETLDVHGLKVKRGFDLRVDLEFTGHK